MSLREERHTDVLLVVIAMLLLEVNVVVLAQDDHKLYESSLNTRHTIVPVSVTTDGTEADDCPFYKIDHSTGLWS